MRAALEGRFPGRSLRFATQSEQRGTADAVRAALGALDGVSGPVLVLYGDTPLLRESTLRALVEAFRAGTAPLALVSTVAPDPTGYGRVLRVSGRITGIVEEKDCTADQRPIREVNAGRLRHRRRVPARGAGPAEAGERAGRVLPDRPRRGGRAARRRGAR